MLKHSKNLTRRILTLLLATSIVFTTVAFELPEAYAASTGSDAEASGLEYNGYPVYRSYIYDGYGSYNSIRALSICYSDGLFLESATKEIEHLAATANMVANSFDYSEKQNEKLLKSLGFANFAERDLHTTTTEETIGARVCSKRIFDNTEDSCILVPIIVRGGSYGNEWGSNFDFGESGDVEGISGAADKVYEWVNRYIKNNSYDTEKVKFWVMGYSRAGGVSNLLSKKLSDKYGKEAVYGFTFEAPKVAYGNSNSFSQYPNIKNYVNANDYIPLFYPTYMGMGLYGKTIKFAEMSDPNFSKYETKMLESYNLIRSEDEEYVSTTNIRRAKLSLKDYNTLLSLIRGGKPYEVGGRTSVSEFESEFYRLIKATVFNDRSEYVNAIPDEVKEASEALKVEACSREQAMRNFGSSVYPKETDVLEHLQKLPFDTNNIVDVNLAVNAYQYLTERKCFMGYSKLVQAMWAKLDNTSGEYIGFSKWAKAEGVLTEEQILKFKASFPMLLYSIAQMMEADDGTVLGTYLYNREMLNESHMEDLNTCWLRAYDSFYDYEQLKITGASALRETELYADSGSEFDNTSITVYNTEGTEVARIDNGIVQAASERSVYIASTKDGNGKNREFSIHTPAYDYTIEITSTSGAQAKKINVIRRNLYNYSEIKNADIIDMQGNRSKKESLTLYSGQKATLHVNNGGTKIEKTVSVESVSSNASCVIEKNGKWSELSTAALTCTDDSKNCVSWYVNDKQLGNGKTYKYSIGLDSPNLRISATANEEHQTATYIIDKKASFDAAGSKHKECPACHEDLTQAGEEQIISPANVAYTNVLTYTGRKLAVPTISVDGAEEGEYEIKYGKSAKSVGEHIAGIVSLKGTDYSGRKICTYSIVPKGTKLTGISATKDSVTVKWNMQKLQTSGYQLQYAADGDFANNAKLINVKNTKTASRKISKLESGTDYSVRIRTYKVVSGEKYYSSWSAAKSIKTKGEKTVEPVVPVVPKTLDKSLPAGYQALEYIESTGTQYIDTGIDSAPGTVITLDLYTPGIAGQYTLSNYATQIGIGHPSYGTASAGRYQFKVVCDGGASIATNLSNGQKQSNHVGSQYYDYSLQPNYICALSNTNGNASHFCECKVYGCAMYRKYGDEMVRYFVPVRTSDGEVGLLDMVNEKFYGNSGNGSFTAGPEISNDDVKMEYANPDYEPAEDEKTLPDQYQAVEYIEGTGTQYIDLDVQAYEDTSTEICIVPDPNYASDNGIWGTYWSGNAQFFMMYKGIYRWHNGGATVVTEAPLAKETTIKTDSTGVTINGEYYACYSGNYFSSNDIRLYGAYGTSTNLGHFKTKYFKIWESGKIVRDLIPCYEKSSNAAGLYDLVTDKFYTNGGSGNFNVGKDVDNSTIKGSYVKAEEEGTEAVQVPEADILSLKVNEDGSAKSVTSRGSYDLVGVGNLNTEETERGLAALFDGETYYKFNEFENYYPEMKKEVTMEFLGSFDYVAGQSYIDFMSNFEGGGLGFECVNGEFGFEAYTDGGYRRTAKAYINPSELVHLVGVYDGTYIKLYVNGKLCSERRVRGNLTFPAATTAHYLCLGGDSTGDGTASSLFAGSMLAANVYSKALTAKQIEALYESYDL